MHGSHRDAHHPATMMHYFHRDDHHHPSSSALHNGSQVLSLALRLLALALALASAVVMLTSTDCASASAAAAYTRYSAFVYLVGSNIAVTLLQAAAIILQALLLAAKGAGTDPDMDACTDHDNEGASSKLPEVLSMAMDVLTLALLFSATGAAYATALGACPRFAEQMATAKALSLGAGIGAALAVVLKHMKLPFNILPPEAA